MKAGGEEVGVEVEARESEEEGAGGLGDELEKGSFMIAKGG